jgi:hypothetical protein
MEGKNLHLTKYVLIDIMSHRVDYIVGPCVATEGKKLHLKKYVLIDMMGHRVDYIVGTI